MRLFQSTLPVGEATGGAADSCVLSRISIHASRGGSDLVVSSPSTHTEISIHASRGGSDSCRYRLYNRISHFNPRFPWGKRRGHPQFKLRDKLISIHASRGGSDLLHSHSSSHLLNFNPRFPWGKRRCFVCHAATVFVFQSTLPVGEATPLLSRHVQPYPISIHASRGGSDTNAAVVDTGYAIFQSTLPVGEATREHCLLPQLQAFQSTLPVGEATALPPRGYNFGNISIHASRGGSDKMSFS